MANTTSLLAAAAAAPEGRRAARRPSAGARTERRTPLGAILLFIGPFLALFAAIVLLPLGYAFVMSLQSTSSSGLGFGEKVTEFVGLDNYASVIADPAFGASLAHVASYCLLYIPIMVLSALALALLLDSAVARFKRLVQLGAFLPYAVPGLIASIIWIYLYTPGLSPVIDALESMGVAVDFFGGGTVVLSMVNIAAWQWIGYNMIIFFAALQAVERETIEAATVDGAGGFRIALRIKVPAIRASVVMVALFTTVGAIQLFTEPQLMTLRSSAVGSSWSPVMYIYNLAFANLDYGRAAAASILLALIAGALSYAITKLGNRWKAS